MFVTFLYRVRAADPGAAVLLAERHMEAERADTYTALYVACYQTGVRAVLVGADDWRKREAQARSYYDTLATEEQALAMARRLRFYWYFHLIDGSPPRRRIQKTLWEEYLSYVTGPDPVARERCFFAATSGIVREVLDDGTWNEPGGLKRYLRQREEAIAAMLRHSTADTYPFTTPGPDLQQSKCFALGPAPDDSPPGTNVHYVVMDVHM
jgi:hypothetical protein